MKKQLLVLTVLIFGMAACSGGGGNGGGGGDKNGGNGIPSSGEGNPLSVLVNLSSTTSSNVIDSAGGEIQLTDAHGNVLTLSIPEGAVYEEEISMTLISYLDGATLSGGLLAGVDIQPNGLQLMKPGTLTIDPYDPNSIGELLSPDSEYLLTAFAYRGDGSDFHYYPYKIIDDKIVMTILGFSGYGGGKSNEGDRQSQKEHLPSNPHDRANQEIAEILTEEARQQAKDQNYEPPEENQEKLTEILRRWLYELVIPMAEEAETNDAILHCAVIEWMIWESTAQILGVLNIDHTPFTSEINKISSHIRKGYENALAKSHQRAVNNNDSSEIYTILLLEAESQLLDFNIDASEILAKVRRFELEFDSRIMESEGNVTIRVETETIALSFDEYDFRYAGTGSVYHVEFDYVCMISHNLTPGTFLADTPDIPVPPATRPSCDGKTLPKPKPPSIDIGLVISFSGPPLEAATIRCDPDDTPVQVGPAPIWFGFFGYLHEDILDPLGGFVVREWDITYGQPYATKTFSNADDFLVENTELTLWYAPLP